jgi:ketosteroid isomerase-like protein
METPEPLRKIVEQWDEARDAGDAGRLASLYAADAVIFLPTGQVLQGREAIKEHYGKMLPLKERDQPRFGPRKFFFFPPIAHATATATGRHGEKHSIVDILAQQPDGDFLFVCSSWTYAAPSRG